VRASSVVCSKYLGCAPHEVHGRPLRLGDLLRIPPTQVAAIRKQLLAANTRLLEYVAYALLGLVLIGGLRYVTTSPEAEDPPKRSDPKQ
jgi:hypothetical protein